MKVYIGYDQREHEAFVVARASIIRRRERDLSIHPLRLQRFVESGLYTRPIRKIGTQMYDTLSDAPMSTEFAITRFFIPIIQHDHWAVFLDSDVVVLSDLSEILHNVDDSKAVYVVKHDYTPCGGSKMDQQQQTIYKRKNWSSVMLFNCAHPAHRRLTLSMLNLLPGRELHGFCWLHDDEIGALDPGWNWLVNEQPKPDSLHIAHYTLGGPWLPNWSPQPHDELWLNERRGAL